MLKVSTQTRKKAAIMRDLCPLLHTSK